MQRRRSNRLAFGVLPTGHAPGGSSEGTESDFIIQRLCKLMLFAGTV
jgi:hypothetical protein